MTVRHLSYLDLTPAQRAKGAAEARQRLVSALSAPFLPADQQAHLRQELAKINQWETGTLPVQAAPKAPAAPVEVPPAPTPAPVVHAVDIQEKLSVVEEK
jgi:hypothetical protein